MASILFPPEVLADPTGLVPLDAVVRSSSEAEAGVPRPQWIDVTFPQSPVQLEAFSFENYYCASISVSHTSIRAMDDPLRQTHTHGRAPTWVTALEKLSLMSDSQLEDDAQAYHEVHAHAHIHE